MRFRDWLHCPSCDDDETSVFAYRTTIALECYGCGRTDEFEIGSDVPVQDFDRLADDDRR